MSEIDFVEINLMGLEGLNSSGMSFVTVVFAYVVAAYVAGEKLPRLPAILLSIIYTLFLIGPLMGVFINLAAIAVNTTEYQNAFPEGARNQAGSLANSATAYVVGVVPLITGWLASLLFMHAYIRNDAAKNRDRDT